MKRILITTVTLMAFLFAAQSAQAVQQVGEIELKVYGKGTVTAPGFDCGSDCTETVVWDDSVPAPEIALTTTPTAQGWAATSWSGCSRFNAERRCVLTFAPGKKTAIVFFNDVQDPTAFINGHSGRAGQQANIQVQASDNEKITKVEYLLDDEVVLTRTSGWDMVDIDTSEVAEGEHTVQVRVTDGNYNSALSQQVTITVDHTAPRVELVDPLPATNADEATFELAFPDGDVHNSYCTIRRQGDDSPFPDPEGEGDEYCWPGEPFSKQVPEEGVWEFVVEANDLVDNKASVVHQFVVDRTAPQAAFTAAPEEGSEVNGKVSFGWNFEDGLPVTQACVWDEGEAVDCDGSANSDLSPGLHSFKVVLTDQAGNETTLTRTFVVRKTADPDPDTTDRTAPVVKLFAPKQTVKSMRRALRLNVRCDEACAGRVAVKGKGGLKFAGRVYLARAGVAKLRLRPTAKVRKRLNLIAARGLRARSIGKRAPRALRFTAAASLSDQAGNTGKTSLKFKVAA